MKIRNGFVSNSSSSSFLVVWDKKPESAQEIQNILFGDEKSVESWGTFTSTKEISETVFRDTPDTMDMASLIENNSYYCSYYEHNGINWHNKGYKSELFQNLIERVEKLIVIPHNIYEIKEKMRKIKNWESLQKSILRKNKLVNIIDGETQDFTTDELKIIDFSKQVEKADKINKEINELYNELSKKSAEKYLEDNKGKFIVEYEYGDDVYENGDIFDSVEYLRTSHH